MKYVCPLLVVENIERSRIFYCQVLQRCVISDFGANITFDGPFSLQSRTSWAGFINKNTKDIVFDCKDSELYFEEENFDAFIEHLRSFAKIEYLHQVIEHPWGQRVVRFYDPDHHIIEVGEDIAIVCSRFLDQGMSIDQVAQRTMYPRSFVEACKN